jgi:hypothetical protein
MGNNMTAIMLAPEITQSLQSICQGIACSGLGHMWLQSHTPHVTQTEQLQDLAAAQQTQHKVPMARCPDDCTWQLCQDSAESMTRDVHSVRIQGK